MKSSNGQSDTFLTWLKDMYVIEQGIVEVLERQVSQLEDMPDVKKKTR